ncbi:hypothetical protein VSW09_001694 [Campylobacter jejuni]|nr:hypothetical protein [Campylobacter jejuni]
MKNQDIFKMQMAMNKDLYIFANEIILELMKKDELYKDDFSKAFEKLKEFKIKQDLELEKAIKELKIECRFSK